MNKYNSGFWFRPKNFPSIIMSIFHSRQSKETTEYSNVVGDFFWSFQIVLKPQKWREIDSRGRGAHISKLKFVLSPKWFWGVEKLGKKEQALKFLWIRRWRLQPRCCSTTLDDPPILEIKTQEFRIAPKLGDATSTTPTMQKLLQNLQKWRKKFQHKIQYEKFQAKEEEQWMDENLANERLERYIVQIFHLRSTGIPANPDRLVALMDDGSFVPLNVCQQ